MRVAAGRLRGRRLHTVAGASTRPTSERARRGLFDWLGARVEGAEVLDLYAGTGALGCEAVSRGARSVVFVERAPGALAALRRNCRDLDLGAAARVVARRVKPALGRLRREGGRFDLVLADPPYAEGAGEVEDVAGLLAPDGVLIVERSARSAAATPGGGLVRMRSRAYGETAFDWYERARGEDA